MILDGGLLRDAEADNQNPETLYIESEYDNDKLGFLLGTAPDYNLGRHRGRVTRVLLRKVS